MAYACGLSARYAADQMDAIRIADGKVVYLKMVETDSDEMRIGTFFSRAEKTNDPRNHCIPILDSFADEHDPDMSYIVMPLMRPIDDPPIPVCARCCIFGGPDTGGMSVCSSAE